MAIGPMPANATAWANASSPSVRSFFIAMALRLYAHVRASMIVHAFGNAA
jgi:hypothetical protein